MGGLLRHNWPWELLAFVLGAAITWLLLTRREHPLPSTPDHHPEETEEPVEEKVLVTAGAPAEKPERQHFSRLMAGSEHAEPTLYDDPDASPAPIGDSGADDVPAGRYGPGSADAVPHQGPPDGFTIKGNAHSMLFHTPDSPYYGRTKPEVWFRTEADAERAGFTKYTRRPRRSPGS